MVFFQSLKFLGKELNTRLMFLLWVILSKLKLLKSIQNLREFLYLLREWAKTLGNKSKVNSKKVKLLKVL